MTVQEAIADTGWPNLPPGQKRAIEAFLDREVDEVPSLIRGIIAFLNQKKSP